jgi:glucokinase
MTSRGTVGLVADIGGTNARFAYAEVDAAGQVRLEAPTSLRAHDYPGIEAAAAVFLDRAGRRPLGFAAAACAGPVIDGKVEMTNLAWRIDGAQFAAALGLPHALLLNDLAAMAWAAPLLTTADLVEIGSAPSRVAAAGEPLLVFNAGTGCNAAAFLPHRPGRPLVCVGEAGHSNFAPTDEIEVEVWRRLAARFGHVSLERLASGPGMLNLYQALADLQGVAAEALTPPDIPVRADAGDRLAGETLDRFCRILGAAAGDLALAFGARGGVQLSGGIPPTLTSRLQSGGFRAAFEAKGRFAGYAAEIPTFIITHPYAALLGGAHAAFVLATG